MSSIYKELSKLNSKTIKLENQQKKEREVLPKSMLLLMLLSRFRCLNLGDPVRPHRRQPTRLPHPWDSPGKNIGVGCHFLLQCMKVKRESEVAQSCPTPSDPMDCSLPGSSVHGIFQARVLERGAIAFSDQKIDGGKSAHRKMLDVISQ